MRAKGARSHNMDTNTHHLFTSENVKSMWTRFEILAVPEHLNRSPSPLPKGSSRLDKSIDCVQSEERVCYVHVRAENNHSNSRQPRVKANIEQINKENTQNTNRLWHLHLWQNKSKENTTKSSKSTEHQQINCSWPTRHDKAFAGW